MSKQNHSAFSGFYKMSMEQRHALLKKYILDDVAVASIAQSCSDDILSVNERLVENCIGAYPLPLAVAFNCCINGKVTPIPFAVEESSVVAALNATGKWLQQQNATVTTTSSAAVAIGQLFFADSKDHKVVQRYVIKQHNKLVAMMNQDIAAAMHKRGGGVKAIEMHEQQNKGRTILALHIICNPCDAMGANMVSQLAEYLKRIIASACNCYAELAIVSNYNPNINVTAYIKIPNITEENIAKIALLSEIATSSCYRAVTHNKGIMNAIEPIAIATGNDWRAISAAVYAYAAQGGYKPLSQWQLQDNTLCGTLSLPLTVAIVGGATCHPMAKISLQMMQVTNSRALAELMAAAGLIQNLAALKALATDGIVAGHMKLHIENLMLAADISPQQQILLRPLLQERLKVLGKVTASDVCALQYDLLQQG